MPDTESTLPTLDALRATKDLNISFADKPDHKHAMENAHGWMVTIVEWLEQVDARDDDYEGDPEDERPEPLSIETRSDWHSPGSSRHMYNEDAGGEFRLLLSTGGPALQIVGGLNDHCEVDADSCRLRWQDWGTLWTEYRMSAHECDALARYAATFWFGE